MKTKHYTSKLDENVTRTDNMTQPQTDTKSTQEELLSGGKTIVKSRKLTRKSTADPKLTKELSRNLDEAAQEGNIGGG